MMAVKRISMLLFVAALFSLFSQGPTLAQSSFSASTPLSGSTRARLVNVKQAVAAIDGLSLELGDEFSFNDLVGPRLSRYGFQSAINGRGVKVVGGGVAQVASTLYLALKQLGSDIEYIERETYGARFNGKYVDSWRDAILVEYDQTDFRFINEYGVLEISMWIEDNRLHCYLEALSSPSAIGSASFSVDGNRATLTNARLAADSIYETLLHPGDTFSFNAIVGERSADFGYKPALNGRGVRVTGGGVAQVASVIWLAVKHLDFVEIIERRTYGSNYSQVYVANSNDAILTDYAQRIDFSFRYVGDGMLSIYTQLDGTELSCNIYEQLE